MDSWVATDIQDFRRTMRGEMDAKMNSLEMKMEEEVREMKNMIEVKFDKDMGEIRDLLKQVLRTHKTDEEIENREEKEETYDYKMKGKVDEPYESKMRDTSTIKGFFLPKVEIKKFDGTDVRTWLSQLEQYFMLHQVPQDKKVALASLHMENEQFQWYQWVRRKRVARTPYTWENLVRDITAQYDDIWDRDYFSQLTKIKQVGPVMDYILQHQKLATRVDGLSDDKLLELYIGGLREEIRHELHILNPPDMTTVIKLARQIEAKNRATRRSISSGEGPFNNRLAPPTRRISTKELDEKRAKGLCFRCDDKWTRDHKCRENKLFILEDTYDEDDDEEEPEEEHPTEKEEEDIATISLHALAGIATPQTLKIIGYIKK